ncbi:aldehyde dehydrogenase family protein [Sphaerimonospora thailandensis]|uniref:Phenylacetaldehyde dehydrogenase n=1 Tax=Sphaerimonospora thailandensis TaxID=795644 RepID=A0A8J3RDQ8_9ACTN|nr:aldehyde dehydrogenase family protein [Sphaerimonospora thailandensis]GIH70603.1 phenylacetaldehyde dehydrogenase [Sphaerimonospora thailandensis]
MKIVNPATEETIAEMEMADAAEMDRAVERARQAFPVWRSVSPGDRARLLRGFARKVEEHAEELARLEIANAGHTVGNARWEAGNVRDVLDFYSGAPERDHGRQIPVPGGVDVTFAEPLGVVGVIVPWNFPMVIMMWGAAPALAAGNTVVVKPAEWTPLTALRLAELALEAGLPEGVLQVVPGEGEVAGARLVGHPDVRKIVFTGSTEVGRLIAAKAAEQVKRVTLELGGKSANIVFADADLDRAATTAPMAVFDNSGQDCCARSRILVERSVYDDFLPRLGRAVQEVKVGDPLDPASQMGPLISAEHQRRVASFVPGPAEYATGSCPRGPGYWFPPLVLTAPKGFDPVDIEPGGSHAAFRRAFTEEIFGPVVCVVPFEDEAHAVQIANNTQYGLSGSIWTRDVGRALRVARAVEAGNLSVNSHSSVRYWTPFGGFKQSGLGRELGPDALAAFTETKNVFIATD